MNILKYLYPIFIGGIVVTMFCSCNRISKVDEALVNAISSGNLESVVTAVESGANVNHIAGFYSRTNFSMHDSNPASLALFENKVDIFKYLIGKGSNPNYTVKNNYSYLMFAITYLDFDLCEFLIDNKVDVNFESKEFGTALDYMFIVEGLHGQNKEKCFEMANYLLSKGAKVTNKTLEAVLKGQNEDGYCRYDLVQFVLKKLIQSGQKSGLNETLEAAILGDTEKVKQNFLANTFRQTDKNKLLFYSVAFGSVNTVRLILEKDKIALKDDLSNTLLMVAAGYNNLDMVNFVSQAANLEDYNIDGYSALTIALMHNQIENAQRLFSLGAKFQVMDRSSYENREEENLNEVLAKKIDVLELSVYNGHLNSVEFILRNNYSGNVENLQYALDTAIERNEHEIAVFISSFEPKG